VAYLLNVAYLTLTRYATQFLYLKELAANKPPHLEISWTTRFNAWVPKDDPYNYVTNEPLPAWVRNSTFATDNEGARFYANVSVDPTPTPTPTPTLTPNPNPNPDPDPNLPPNPLTP